MLCELNLGMECKGYKGLHCRKSVGVIVVGREDFGKWVSSEQEAVSCLLRCKAQQ